MATCPTCKKPCTIAYYDKDYKHFACDQCITPEKMKTCDVCSSDTHICYYNSKGQKLGCRFCMHIHLANTRDEFTV